MNTDHCTTLGFAKLNHSQVTVLLEHPGRTQSWISSFCFHPCQCRWCLYLSSFECSKAHYLVSSVSRRFRPPTTGFHEGELVDCLPFGQVCRCNVQYFSQLSALVKSCQAYLPFLTFDSLFCVTNAAVYKTALNQHFYIGFSTGSSHFLYADVEVQIKRLEEISRQLSTAASIKTKFLACTRHHNPMSSDSKALIILGNLRLLLDCVQSKRTSLEEDWWRFLDKYPRKSEEMLRVLMDEVRKLLIFSNCFYWHRIDKKSGWSAVGFHTLHHLSWLQYSWCWTLA